MTRRRVRALAALGPVLAIALTLTALPVAAEPLVSSVQVVPTAPGGVFGSVGSNLSCPAAGACTLVTPAGPADFLSENDGVWGSPATIPRSPGQYGGDGVISCVDPQDCTDVGSNGDPVAATETAGSWGPLVDLWSGWSNNIEGPGEMNFGALQCFSVGSCIAVGTYTDDSYIWHAHEFAVTETDGTWGKPINLPDTPNVWGVYELGLACVDVDHCTAIGWNQQEVSYGTTQPPNLPPARTYAWTYLRGSWSKPSAVGTDGWFGSTAVACPTTTTCIAVGERQSNLPTPAYDVETNGRWSEPRTLPLPKLALQFDQGTLNSIACISRTTCMAEGEFTASSRNGLLEDAQLAGVLTWNQAGWSSVDLVDGAQPLGATTGDYVDAGAITCVASTCELAGTAAQYGAANFEDLLGQEEFFAVVAPQRSVTRPGPPTWPTGSELLGGPSTVIARWNPPIDDGGAPIRSFTAIALGTRDRCTTTKLACTIQHLRRGARYAIVVTDVTSWGISAPSIPEYVRPG